MRDVKTYYSIDNRQLEANLYKRLEDAMLENPATRLALDTAYEMFEKLKWEEARLVESWGVYDSLIARKAALPSGAKEVFHAVRDVSNGSKHWKMTHKRSLQEQVITNVERPVMGCWYAVVEDKPMAYFDLSGYSLSMAELSAFVMQY